MIRDCQPKQKLMTCIQFTGKNFKHLQKMLGPRFGYERNTPCVRVGSKWSCLDVADWIVVDGEEVKVMNDDMFDSMFDIV